MTKIILSILVVLFMGIIVSVPLYSLKVDNAFKNHMIITKAISEHNKACIHTGCYRIYGISYDEMEDYDSTIRRFWDWGYTRILPKDKYEQIKHLIQ